MAGWMIAWLVVALLPLAPPVRANEIYRWTDRAGGVHFSNTPTVGAEPADSEAAAEPDAPASDVHGEAVTDTPPPEETTPSDEDRAYFATASLKRNALERELRATDKQLRALDERLAAMARARTRNQAGSAATGGVGTSAGAIRSDEERLLAAEREQIEKRAKELRTEGSRLRDEVTARVGSTPTWWIDVR
jgi:Domain of unknown function (DUF4124)